MATLHNLNHLDGKQVKFSTISSTNPQVFISRKRNTGDLIITSDETDIYGIHHIYAGGEHLAGGYGFATENIVNDLTYVSSSYNGIFNYIDSSYYYSKTNIELLNNKIYNQASYFNNQIAYSSYFNVSVDYNNNKLSNADTTYTLNFNNGVLNVSYIGNGFNINIINNTYTYLAFNDKSVTNQEIHMGVTTNINDSSFSKMFKRVKKFTKTISETVQNIDCDFNTIDPEPFFLYNTKYDKDTNTYNSNITIPNNCDTKFNIEYKYDRIGNETVTNSIYFLWKHACYYGTTTNINNIKVPVNNKIFIGTDEYIDLDITTGTSSAPSVAPKYIYILIPTIITNPKFYMSNSTVKSDYAGGFAKYSLTSDKQIVFNNFIYNIYISEPQYFNKKLRIDIIWE